MATTYTKVLKTISITTIGGKTITVEDTAAQPYASNALAEFEAFQTMHCYGTVERFENPIKCVIPFHAVDAIALTETESETTRPDPYGCEGGSEGEDGGK